MEVGFAFVDMNRGMQTTSGVRHRKGHRKEHRRRGKLRDNRTCRVDRGVNRRFYSEEVDERANTSEQGKRSVKKSG